MIFFNYYSLSLFLGGVVALASGAIVFFANQNTAARVRIPWMLLNLSTAVWSFGYYAMIISKLQTSAFFYDWVLHVGAILIPIFYLWFILELTDGFAAHRWVLFSSIPFAGLLLLLGNTPLLVRDVLPKYIFNFAPDAGPLYWLFALYFFGYTIYAGLVLLQKIVTVPHHDSVRLRYVFGSSLAGFIGGGSVFLLTFNIFIPPYPIVLFTFYPLIITYAILRHRLFSIKVVATELLTFALWILLLFRTILSSQPEDIFINLPLLIATVILGLFLIRSVIQEVAAREEIARLSDEKSEFMTFASHEIRNPITAMRGYASLINDGTVGEVSTQVRDVAQKILVMGDEVLALIGQFLNKSKMELGKIVYTISECDLGKAVSSVVDGYAPHAQQRGLKLIKDVDPNEDLRAKADETKVKEVVGNLVDNALKYTKHGSITVSAHRHGVHVRIVITDTGVGIPKETIPHLFKKFSRADAQKVNIKGTGIGLYLAKTFIEGMGARIWVESDGIDKGSRFIIEFSAA